MARSANAQVSSRRCCTRFRSVSDDRVPDRPRRRWRRAPGIGYDTNWTSGGVMSIVKQCVLGVLLAVVAATAGAEMAEINVAQQYGVSFLPLMLMERDKLG